MNSLKIAGVGVLISASLIFGGCSDASSFVMSAPNKPTPVGVTETTAPETEAPEIITQLAVVVTAEELKELESYQDLEQLDLTGSTCYRAIEAFIKAHPKIQVTYTVSLGSISVDSGAEEITLSASQTDHASLLEGLRYLNQLKKVTLSRTDLTAEELTELRDEYPDLEINYTLDMLGKEYSADTETLDLSELTSDGVAQVCRVLPALPNLQTVELTDSSGKSQLSKSDVKTLAEAAPNTVFHYCFTLFGKEVSTTDEVIEFKNLSLANDRADEIREALDILTGCKTFILDNCGIDYDVLAQIRDEYERTDLVWRVNVGKYSVMTNAETIRFVYNVHDSTCYNLRYCRNVKYMDLGHNEDLTDLSFVGFMPDLEILIVSQTSVSDLTGFENCKKLEFLEMAFCGNLSDLTPLSGCVNLKNLNICYTKVSNLMALDGLPLERLSCKQARVPAKEQKTFKEIHPDCIALFTGTQPYAGAGWRYVDNGKTYTEIYKKVREVFNYDQMDKNIRNMEEAAK